MAKSKNTVDLDVNVKGKGTKKTTLEMKNLGDQTKKVSKSTAEANRNWKGASQQSSGASKNFSKMSQGMGGIVGAYATLAANIFAIGAAFRFLESAGNLQKLKEGQELYAAATGTALRSLTKDIIAATDAQITFENASQSAAIGKAAGLTNDQLTALGKGAKDVSIILGRDVTDSFNRLVRGVTKAEPELLDELGIILRLADASEKYGTMIGKNAQDLTQYEKSQAVTVEVLGQLEDKYGRIMAVVEPSGNTFTQLGVAFDNIVNQIKEVAMVVAGPIAEVLTRVPQLAFGILAAFANSLIRTSMASWADNAAVSAKRLGTEYADTTRKLKVLQRYRRMKLQGQGGWSSTAAAKKADTGLGGITSKGKVAGPAFEKLRAGEALSKKEIQAARMVVQRKKGLDKQMKDNYIAALKEMELKTKTTAEKIKIDFSIATSKLGVLAIKTKLAWKGAMEGIAKAGTWAAGKLTAVMSAVSWISIIATLGTVIYQFFKTEEAVDEVDKRISAATEKVTALNEEFIHFNEIQKIIIEDGSNMLAFFEALANRISQLGVSTQTSLFENMKETVGDMLKTPLNEAAKEIERLEQDFIFTWEAASSDFAQGTRTLEIYRYSEAVNELEVLEQRLERLKGSGYADPSLRRRAMDVDSGVYLGRLPELELREIQPGGAFHAEQIRDTESAIAKLKPVVDATGQAMRILEGDVIEFMAASDDPALSQLGLHFKDLLVSQELLNKQFTDTNAVTEYFALLQKLTDARSWERQEVTGEAYGETFTRLETIEEMFLRITTAITRAQSASDEWYGTLSNAKRMATENAQEVDKLLLDVQKRSAEGRMEDTLLDEYRNRVKLVFDEEITRQQAALEIMQTNFFQQTGIGSEVRPDMSPRFTDPQEQKAWDAENAALVRQISLFDRLDRMKDDSKKRGLVQTLAEQKALLGATKLVGARIKLEATLDKQENKRKDLKDELLTITEKIREVAIDTNNANWEGEEQQQRRIEQLHLELEISEALTEETERRLDLNKQIFDAANQAMETSLTKTLASFLKFEERSFGDAMKKMAESVFGAMADSLAKQAAEWLMRKDPLAAFRDGGQIVYDKIVDAFQSVGFGGAGGTDAVATAYPAVDTAAGISRVPIGGTESAKQASSAARLSSLPEDMFKIKTADPEKGMFAGVIDPLKKLFTDDAPWMDKLGEFFGGDSSFLKGLGGIFGELGTGFMSLLSNIPGMGFLSFLGADGGIVKGGFRKYARGGIATSPTLGLIGEGKHNEAVVPLPNGKAIPVDMRSSAQTNNVTVNVSTDGQTQTEGGADSEGLGRAVAKAVQEELQNQKRAGGILNRYGTA